MSSLRFPPLPEWTGRDDGLGPERFHQIVQSLELDTVPFAKGRQFAFVGFACDEGVRRNQGRPGAANGPEALRTALSSLAWKTEASFSIIDVGDVVCDDSDLEGAQKELGRVVSVLLAKRYLPIVLGGGHETAWGHYQGLAAQNKQVLIINLDAHYDLRPLVDGKWGSSGTPFLQIAHDCQARKIPFSYLCLGIQESSNTESLKKTAHNLNVHAVDAQTLHSSGSASTLKLLDDLLAKHAHVYLSLCMDVFAQAFAPGVSAPQALGLFPTHILPLLRKIVSSGKVISFDVVELCPPWDRDQQTAKLAASMVWNFMNGF